MSSLVLELQIEAIDSKTKVIDLLRKSLVVARKLELQDFEEWIDQELNGFKHFMHKVPKYREVVGKIQYYNIVHGWWPVTIEDPKILELITKTKIGQPLSEIEDLVTHTKDNLVIEVPMELQNILSKSLGERLDFRVIFGKSQAQAIIDQVKNIILEWSLKLEKDGITGEGLSFSKQEKVEATKHDYAFFLSNVGGVQIQQNSPNSQQYMTNNLNLSDVSSFISTLKNHMHEIGLNDDSQMILRNEINQIHTQIQSSNPQKSLVKESLLTIRNVLEGVTGSIIASGLLHEVSKIIN
ncbi:hypothetical protein OKS35_14545 [Exiguobacterium sp. N5]|uniref:AbiTii domain-containing protein n=1 Tax=Exiguobacterium sp. N5 TaxID=2990450 RepID=UPI0021F3CFB9|nr:hypothetical protein [Exiguobacterium sp. N5]MCV9901345.1 hypothetical protein [Exiguobacterium sp. N5]